MNCKLTNDMLRTNSCGYSLPEIVDIYLANYEDVLEATPSETESGNEISDITLATDATTSASTKFYHIEPAKNSASFEDALVVGDSGNKYRTHTLTFSVIGKYDKVRSLDLDNLSLGKYFAVVKTAEGNYLALGRVNGLEAETATLAGGTDNNGIQVVLTANVTESAYPLSETAIKKVLGE